MNSSNHKYPKSPKSLLHISITFLCIISLIQCSPPNIQNDIIGIYHLEEGPSFHDEDTDEYLCILNDSVFVFGGKVESCLGTGSYHCHSFAKGKWKIRDGKLILKTRSYEEEADIDGIDDYLNSLYPNDSIIEQLIYVIGGEVEFEIVNQDQLKWKNSKYLKERTKI